MRRMVSLFLVLAAGVVAAAPGCTSVECGVGTVERNGACEPSDSSFGSATCGSGTVLIGDRCVTTVECDPDTTMQMVGSDGSVVCVGVGENIPCGMPLPCPQPAAGKQTVCGQLYDIETGSAFEATGGTGTRCTGGETSGPCALRMDAYDASLFATDPMAPTLNVGDKYMDDCGRYKFTDITPPAGPFVGLGFDDADPVNKGGPGLTNAVGVALPANPDSATNKFEAWIAKKSTTDKWAQDGGPSVSTGFHVLIFRAHKCDATTGQCNGDAQENQPGVQIYKNTLAVPNNDFYFDAADAGHTTIDPAATVTGANGTGLLTGASVTDNLVWTGMGGLSDTTNCKWESHAAASIPNVVSFQIYRPANQVGHTCNQ